MSLLDYFWSDIKDLVQCTRTELRQIENQERNTKEAVIKKLQGQIFAEILWEEYQEFRIHPSPDSLFQRIRSFPTKNISNVPSENVNLQQASQALFDNFVELLGESHSAKLQSVDDSEL